MRFSYESGMRQVPPAAASAPPPEEYRRADLQTSDLMEDAP
jgi:hypothetical protein